MKEAAIKKLTSTTTIISKMINQLLTIINHLIHLAISTEETIPPLITIILNHTIRMKILIKKTTILIIPIADQ